MNIKKGDYVVLKPNIGNLAEISLNGDHFRYRKTRFTTPMIVVRDCRHVKNQLGNYESVVFVRRMGWFFESELIKEMPIKTIIKKIRSDRNE